MKTMMPFATAMVQGGSACQALFALSLGAQMGRDVRALAGVKRLGACACERHHLGFDLIPSFRPRKGPHSNLGWTMYK